MGMLSLTRRVICWVAIHVYFMLSSKQEWGKKDGSFDYEEYFWFLDSIFDNEVLGKSILTMWNKAILGTNPAEPQTEEPAAGDDGLSHLERMQARAAAAKAAAAATTDNTSAASPDPAAAPAGTGTAAPAADNAPASLDAAPAATDVIGQCSAIKFHQNSASDLSDRSGGPLALRACERSEHTAL
ncbi:hypothetical protein C8J57DRAFT_1707412 [Mycena rebaudengoi]|nr:hypothetical protein C8J57DRAFT_1707412 [Mycena rebaudengoi]